MVVCEGDCFLRFANFITVYRQGKNTCALTSTTQFVSGAGWYNLQKEKRTEINHAAFSSNSFIQFIVYDSVGLIQVYFIFAI